jgi:predicted nuclease of restriction endonuclease-like (RecB) superfamily
MKKQASLQAEQRLLFELSHLIEQSQQQVISQANSTLTMLFWRVGHRIQQEILQYKRAEYGKQIVSRLSQQLQEKYGRNFELGNLRRMIQFSQQFPDVEIVATLSRQLSWSHFRELIPIKDIEARKFYTELCSSQTLGIRELRLQINNKAFERSSIANLQNTSKHPAMYNTFKDPYFLDFLGLQPTFLEKDLEGAILQDLERFILELGKGFAFVERQKRMIIDGEDFHLDLLFYHRNLKRLVAIELKLGKFEAEHKGQMELYLKWLDKYEKAEGENPPVGLILCTERSKEQVELLEMHKDGMMVAEYWTELPPKKELEQKIQSILLEAQDRIAQQKQLSN